MTTTTSYYYYYDGGASKQPAGVKDMALLFV